MAIESIRDAMRESFLLICSIALAGCQCHCFLDTGLDIIDLWGTQDSSAKTPKMADKSSFRPVLDLCYLETASLSGHHSRFGTTPKSK